MADLLQFTERGIYCPPADVYIDPWRAVRRALITHGHADHSRWGHEHYLTTAAAAPVIRYRLGDIRLQTVAYGQVTNINGVRFSFHPAGHIPGSAQIRVAYRGEVWVASGDYKLEDDGLSEPFESIPCHTFITESTFGLPVYNWRPQAEVFADINAWWQTNAAAGKVSLLTGYSLGKAQRILRGLDPALGTIYTHAAVENINEVLRAQGINLPPTTRVTPDIPPETFRGQLVLAPPAVLESRWMKKLPSVVTGICSGWMTLRGARRRRAADRGFILSDHVDWKDLNTAVTATGAERVIVTHGYTKIYARYLSSQGLQGEEATTEYSGESLEDTPAATTPST